MTDIILKECRKCKIEPELVHVNVLGKAGNEYLYRCPECKQEIRPQTSILRAAAKWNRKQKKTDNE